MWKDIAVGKTAANDTKTIALIDADGILYAAALGGQTDCEGEALVLTTVDVVYANAMERVEEQVKWAKGDDAFIVLSDRRNFRTEILPVGHHGSQGELGYKGQRKASARPVLLDALRAKVVEEACYKTMLIVGLEADDVCGISAGVFQAAGKHTVIVSPDKDLLTIPGDVLTIGKGQRVLIHVTQEMADWKHRMQTLTGDTCDNYRGCPGWGASKAEKLLANCKLEGLEDWAVWEEIIKCFLKAGLTKEDCLVQAQVSRICRVTDWDAKLKEVIPFQFPTKPKEA